MPVQIDVASEFRYRDPVLDAETLVIGITQSGETADTLAAMRLAREAGSPVLALTNIMGSQATRDADAVLFTRAGLEIGVAATKTHVAQVAALLLFTLDLARARGTLSEEERLRLGRELHAVPLLVQRLLDAQGEDGHDGVRRSPSATTTSASSSTWAATWASASVSRARSSSRRSATSRPRPTRPAR